MATRPVFLSKESYPFYSVCNVEFEFNRGMAPSQKKKNIEAIHSKFREICPEMKILEISSKSLQEEGVLLSAFNLKKFVPSVGEKLPVESIYHSAKIFENGKNYPDIMFKSPKDAKHDERLKNSGKIIGFRYEGREIPSYPMNLFYDYLYISALAENPSLAEKILMYDAFTDIEFTPSKSVNCQARAAAVFLSLEKMNLSEKIKDFDVFYEILNGKYTLNTDIEDKTAEVKEISEGDILIHSNYGEGVVYEVSSTMLKCRFEKAGEKKLSKEWAEKNCRVVRK